MAGSEHRVCRGITPPARSLSGKGQTVGVYNLHMYTTPLLGPLIVYSYSEMARFLQTSTKHDPVSVWKD